MREALRHGIEDLVAGRQGWRRPRHRPPGGALLPGRGASGQGVPNALANDVEELVEEARQRPSAHHTRAGEALGCHQADRSEVGLRAASLSRWDSIQALASASERKAG